MRDAGARRLAASNDVQVSKMLQAERTQSTRRSDPGAWLDRHGDMLFRYALMRLRDEHLAEEAVQETFLAAMAGSSDFAGRSAERTWLIGILRHKLVDALRRRKRQSDIAEETAFERHCESLFTQAGKWSGALPAPGSAPRCTDMATDFRRAFEECLESLPARAAAAFVLTELDGWEGSRVCEALGVTPVNYWAMMSRARLQLRRCLTAKRALDGFPGCHPC